MIPDIKRILDLRIPYEILYLCNCKKDCKNKDGSCGTLCTHTADINYALNYEKIPDVKDLEKYFKIIGQANRVLLVEKEDRDKNDILAEVKNLNNEGKLVLPSNNTTED